MPCAAPQISVQLQGQIPSSVAATDITYEWHTDCLSGQFDDATSPAPVLTLKAFDQSKVPSSCMAQLTVRSLGSQAEGSCFAPVTVRGCPFDCLGQFNGTALYDRCGVCDGNGQSCLGCEPKEITAQLLGLDGNAATQNRLIHDTTIVLEKAYPKNKSLKKFGVKIRATSSALYKQSWQLAWTLPTVVQKCTNSVFCAEFSSAAVLDAFEKNARQFDKLIRDVAAKYLQITHNRKRATKLINQSKQLLAGSLAISSAVPRTTSHCSP